MERNPVSTSDEIDLKDVLAFLWSIRLALIAGAFLGAIGGGAYAYLSRSVSYSSTFIIEISNEYPFTIRDAKTISAEVRNLLKSPPGIREMLLENMRQESGTNDMKSLTNQLLVRETEAMVDDYLKNLSNPKIGSEGLSNIFNIIPTTQSDAYILSITLPFDGLYPSLGQGSVAALNRLIINKNKVELAAIGNAAKTKIKNQSDYAKEYREEISEGIRASEAGDIAARTELADLEFELIKYVPKSQIISDFLSFSRNLGTIGPVKSESSSRNDITDDFEDRIGRIVSLLSVLKDEGRLDADRVEAIHKQISGIRKEYQKSKIEITAASRAETSFKNQFNEVILNSSIEISKGLLPTFKLDEDYYKTLLSAATSKPHSRLIEKPKYDISIQKCVQLGAVLGLIVSFFLPMIPFFVKNVSVQRWFPHKPESPQENTRKGYIETKSS